jgi:hypothetical protein
MEIYRDSALLQKLRLEPGRTTRLNRGEDATYFWVFPNTSGIGVSYSGFTPPFYIEFPNDIGGHLKVKFIARGDDAWEKFSIFSTVFSGDIKGVPGTIDSLFWEEHKKSNFEAELKKFGAKEITLPVVTSITLLAIKRAEAKAGRKLSFAEVATTGPPHLELMLAGEMQWAMQQMFRQYDLIADLLVPSEQMPEVEPQTEPAAKPARSKQPMLNLGE